MLRLRYERLVRGLNQHQLGKLASVSQGQLSLFEQGRCSPTPEQLARLAGALNVAPPDRLLRPVVVADVDSQPAVPR